MATGPSYMMKSNARPEGVWSSKIPVAYLPVGHALFLGLRVREERQ